MANIAQTKESRAAESANSTAAREQPDVQRNVLRLFGRVDVCIPPEAAAAAAAAALPAADAAAAAAELDSTCRPGCSRVASRPAAGKALPQKQAHGSCL